MQVTCFWHQNIRNDNILLNKINDNGLLPTCRKKTKCNKT